MPSNTTTSNQRTGIRLAENEKLVVGKNGVAGNEILDELEEVLSDLVLSAVIVDGEEAVREAGADGIVDIELHEWRSERQTM